jgi:FkbM family methyltransferase
VLNHVLKERSMADNSKGAADDGPRERRAIEGLRRRLRPAKVRAGVRRRWFELIMERTSVHPAGGLVTLGSPYGSWIVPGDLIERSWVCYCVGAGGDVTFDLELIRRYGVIVRAFDPVASYVRTSLEQADGVPGFSAYQAGIATSDGPLRMQVTHDPSSDSVSAAGLYDSARFVELPGRSLPSLMAELGDERIDLLKLDVEGGEYQLLPELDLRALGVKVFAMQLHHTGSVRDARALIADLARQGYVPLARHPAVKLTFARAELLGGREPASAS